MTTVFVGIFFINDPRPSLARKNNKRYKNWTGPPSPTRLRASHFGAVNWATARQFIVFADKLVDLIGPRALLRRAQ
jgi:hypothetical protein